MPAINRTRRFREACSGGVVFVVVGLDGGVDVWHGDESRGFGGEGEFQLEVANESVSFEYTQDLERCGGRVRCIGAYFVEQVMEDDGKLEDVADAAFLQRFDCLGPKVLGRGEFGDHEYGCEVQVAEMGPGLGRGLLGGELGQDGTRFDNGGIDPIPVPGSDVDDCPVDFDNIAVPQHEVRFAGLKGTGVFDKKEYAGFAGMVARMGLLPLGQDVEDVEFEELAHKLKVHVRHCVSPRW